MKSTARSLQCFSGTRETAVMSVLFSKNFPDMFLRIQLWAVTWQVVQSHLVARIFHEVCDRFTLVIRSAIKNENQGLLEVVWVYLDHFRAPATCRSGLSG